MCVCVCVCVCEQRVICAETTVTTTFIHLFSHFMNANESLFVLLWCTESPVTREEPVREKRRRGTDRRIALAMLLNKWIAMREQAADSLICCVTGCNKLRKERERERERERGYL